MQEGARVTDSGPFLHLGLDPDSGLRLEWLSCCRYPASR